MTIDLKAIEAAKRLLARTYCYDGDDDTDHNSDGRAVARALLEADKWAHWAELYIDLVQAQASEQEDRAEKAEAEAAEWKAEAERRDVAWTKTIKQKDRLEAEFTEAMQSAESHLIRANIAEAKLAALRQAVQAVIDQRHIIAEATGTPADGGRYIQDVLREKTAPYMGGEPA